MNSDNFEREFIKVDFDNILAENNNNLVNSDEHYTKYKSSYISNAYSRLENYKTLEKEMSMLCNKEVINVSHCKVKYTFIESDKVAIVKQEMKNIMLQQKKDLKQFLTYLEHLNRESDVLQQQNTQPLEITPAVKSKSRGMFAKLLDHRRAR
jgi:hypothetical protein